MDEVLLLGMAYNTMDIWDFNEKYGELWDFTIKNQDIIKGLQ